MNANDHGGTAMDDDDDPIIIAYYEYLGDEDDYDGSPAERAAVVKLAAACRKYLVAHDDRGDDFPADPIDQLVREYVIGLAREHHYDSSECAAAANALLDAVDAASDAVTG